MASYNKVLLMGNLTRDIELRHLPQTNNAVATIGIAVNHSWRDKNTNELREEVTFVDCEAFGRTAETMAKYLTKGRSVFIEGRLKLDTWKDKTDGSNRSKMRVVVEEFRFMDSKGPGGEGGGGGGGYSNDRPAQRPAPARAGAGSPPPGKQLRDDGSGYEPIQEDDIPF